MVSGAREARFERIFRAHSNEILGYLARRTEPTEDAADLMSEVFATAWRRVDDLPPGDETRLWLYGTARKVLANHRRSRTRRDRLAGQLREALVHHVRTGAADGADPRVRAALAGLPDGDRELLTLTAWEEMTPAEIAVVLDLSPATVRTRLSRARTRLRAALAVQDVAC